MKITNKAGGMKPKQRIPESQKDDEWFFNSIYYFRGASNSFTDTKKEFDVWLRIANGELIPEHYEYVTNPFGNAIRGRTELQNYPARMRNYDMVSSLIGLHMGEKNRRKLITQVIAIDTDFPEMRQEREYEKVLDSMFQEYQFMAGLTDEEPPTVESIQKEIEDMKDESAIAGTKVLKYADHEYEIPRKQRKGFYFWLVTGRVFSYKDMYHDDLEYEIINPMNIDFLLQEDEEFIEDGEAVKYRKKMAVNEVVDRFQDLLTEDELLELEARFGSSGAGTANNVGSHASDIDPHYFEVFAENMSRRDESFKGTSTNLSVEHIVFRGYTKIGMLRTFDVFGNLIEIEVDEDFLPMKGEEVEWKWVDQIYEGYIIEDTYAVGMQAIPYRRGSFYSPRSAKLPYNGRFNTYSHNTQPISLAQRLYPYQIKYNIIHYRLELTLAKNKDKLIFLPLGIVPSTDNQEAGASWDRYTTMYYGDATGYMWFDETDDAVLRSLQHVKVLDASLSQYIREIYNHLAQIRAEAKELVGLNEQRTGNMTASETVGNVQESIFRSNLMTEELFVQYEEFQERDYKGVLQLAQYAYSNGKRLTLPKEDGTVEIYDVEPTFFSKPNLGVFVKSGAEMQEDLAALKANAQAFAQNQMRPATLAKIIHEKNYHQLLKILDEEDEKLTQMQAQGVQAEQAKNQQEMEVEMMNAERDRASKETIGLRNNATAVQVALINSSGSDGEVSTTDINAITENANKLAIEREKLAVVRENNIRDNATKQKDSEIKLKVAKENKNKYDKAKS